jgi:hypothetical protein
MVTKRVPLKRDLRRRITPEVVAAFKRMQAADAACDCAEKHERREDWWPCEHRDEWWEAHRIIHRALGMKPWNWPCVLKPGSKLHGDDDEKAVERWRQIEEVAKAER